MNMISLFEIENDVIIVSQHVLLVDEFAAVWALSSDKELIKSTHFKYIEFFCSPYKTNIYADLDNGSRELLLKKDIYKDEEYELPEEVKRAIYFYGGIFISNIFTLSLLDSVMNGAVQVRDHMNSLDLNERTNSGAKVTKPSEVFAAIEKLETAVISIENLRKRVYQDLKKVKLKGNVQIGHFER